MWESLKKKVKKRTHRTQFLSIPDLDDFDLLLLHELLFDQALEYINGFGDLQTSSHRLSSHLDFSQSLTETEVLNRIKINNNLADNATDGLDFLVKLNDDMNEQMGGELPVGEKLNFLYHAFYISSKKLQSEFKFLENMDRYLKNCPSDSTLAQTKDHLMNMELVMSRIWQFVEQSAPDSKLNECKYNYSRLVETIRDLQDVVDQKSDLRERLPNIEMQVSNLKFYTRKCSDWLDKLALDSEEIIEFPIPSIKH
jgi:hypothetical protein